MRLQPVAFLWQPVEVIDGKTGEAARQMAMVPLKKYLGVCKRQFGDGGEHVLEPVVDRDMRSHNAFFAEISSHYDNLPESVAFLKGGDGKFLLDEHGQRVLRWPTSEHFRKWILVEVGFCETKEFECANREHAKNLGKFIRIEDDYARIKIRGNVVEVKKPMSQSLAAMKAQTFEDSKRACLDLAEAMTGIPRGAMRKNAGRSA